MRLIIPVQIANPQVVAKIEHLIPTAAAVGMIAVDTSALMAIILGEPDVESALPHP